MAKGNRKTGRTQDPAYIRKLQAAVEAGHVSFAPGGVSILHIYHDDGCPALKGGVCSCDPDIEQTVVSDPDKEGSDGKQS